MLGRASLRGGQQGRLSWEPLRSRLGPWLSPGLFWLSCQCLGQPSFSRRHHACADSRGSEKNTPPLCHSLSAFEGLSSRKFPLSDFPGKRKGLQMAKGKAARGQVGSRDPLSKEEGGTGKRGGRELLKMSYFQHKPQWSSQAILGWPGFLKTGVIISQLLFPVA